MRAGFAAIGSAALPAAGEIGLQPDGALAALDQPLGHADQAAELGGAQAFELHVVDLALDRRQLGQLGAARGRDLEPDAAAIVRVRAFVDQAALQQLVRHRGDERAAQMQMRGDPVDADIAFLGGEMADRDQHGIFDAGQPDARGVAGAHDLVECQEAEQPVHQATEFAVRAADQQLGARDGERRRDGRRFRFRHGALSTRSPRSLSSAMLPER